LERGERRMGVWGLGQKVASCVEGKEMAGNLSWRKGGEEKVGGLSPWKIGGKLQARKKEPPMKGVNGNAVSFDVSQIWETLSVETKGKKRRGLASSGDPLIVVREDAQRNRIWGELGEEGCDGGEEKQLRLRKRKEGNGPITKDLTNRKGHPSSS